MSKGILGSVAALLVSSGLLSAQVPVPGSLAPDGPQPPPNWNPMEGPGDFHPDHGYPGQPNGPGDFQQGGIPGGWPPFWIRGEWLYMQIKNQPLPVPLITESDAASLGIIGNPGTVVVFGGNDVYMHHFTGGRLTAGLTICCEPNFGLEVSAFTTEKQTVRFDAASDAAGNPVIARPFFDVVNQVENAIAVSFPGAFAGSVSATVSSQFWGGDFCFTLGTAQNTWWSATLLAGFKYLEFDEQIQVSQFSVILPGGSASVAGVPVNAPNGIAILDDFDTRNQFYGGLIGGRVEARYGRLTLEVTEKFGIGATHQVVGIQGSTTAVTPPITVPGSVLSNTFPSLFPPQITISNGIMSFPGGVLATETNSGQHVRTQFSLASDTNVSLRLKLTKCISLVGGYNFIWLKEVVRPGNEIDRNVNQATIPSSPAFSTFVVFPRQPAFSFREGNIWAHGTNLGLQIDF
jgi:hypothetical protein